MIADFPLISKKDIVLAFKPGHAGSLDAAYRTLRDKGVVSEGIDVRPRTETGQLLGRLHLYCVLNRDAALLARRSSLAEARKLARAARRIERGKVARELANALEQAAGGNLPQSTIQGVLGAAAGNEMMRSHLRTLTDAVQAAREASKPLAEVEWRVFGRVARLEADFVEVKTNDASRLFVPMINLDESLRRVGAALSLHWETLETGQAIYQAEPALDTEATAETPRPGDELVPEFPFLQHDAEIDEDLAQRFEEFLADSDAVRLPAPIAVREP